MCRTSIKARRCRESCVCLGTSSEQQDHHKGPDWQEKSPYYLAYGVLKQLPLIVYLGLGTSHQLLTPVLEGHNFFLLTPGETSAHGICTDSAARLLPSPLWRVRAARRPLPVGVGVGKWRGEIRNGQVAGDAGDDE